MTENPPPSLLTGCLQSIEGLQELLEVCDTVEVGVLRADILSQLLHAPECPDFIGGVSYSSFSLC
jgi:hypothetical protein